MMKKPSMSRVVRFLPFALVLLLAPPSVAQFQSCVYCDVRPFNPDPLPMAACDSGTLTIRGAGYRDRAVNGCSVVPVVNVRSTRPDRLTVLAFRVLDDGRIEVDYQVPCNASGGLVGLDVTIDDNVTDSIPAYACGNARILVSRQLAIVFGSYRAVRGPAGIVVSWQTVEESDTSLFEVQGRDAAGQVITSTLVDAHGLASRYSIADASGSALAGGVREYRVVECTSNGYGDETGWFPVEEGQGAGTGRAGSRRRASGGR